MIVLRLPFPPSLNGLYGRGPQGRVYLKKAGRNYRKVVCGILSLARVKPVDGPLAVLVHVHPPLPLAGAPPVNRIDLDNTQKILLDSLQAGGLFADDGEIEDLRVKRRRAVPGGEVRVRVARYEPESDELDVKDAGREE